ncbi:MAG TPA: hypothetical protein VIJ92_01860 [Ginsengibacter sp.]
MEIVQIGNEDFLLRRIPISPSYIKPDGSISSFAFTLKKGEDGISTDLERLADKDKSVLDRTKYRLAKINAGIIRNDINDGLDCKHNPLPDNYAHSLITSQSGKISDSKSRAMSRSAVIV